MMRAHYIAAGALRGEKKHPAAGGWVSFGYDSIASAQMCGRVSTSLVSTSGKPLAKPFKPML